MSVRIQLRRDTAANWTATNPTLTQGEPGYETDTGKIKYGDGSTAWNSLAYASAGLPAAFAAGTAAAPGFAVDGDSNTGLYSPGADQLAISTNGTKRLQIDSGGNVSIDAVTNTGAKPLAIYSAARDAEIRLTTNSGTQNDAYFTLRNSGGNVDIYSTNGAITLNPANTERLRITAAGLVGIGSSSPVATNHIRGSGTSGQVTASWMLENASSGTVGMDVTGAAGSSIWRFLYGGGPNTGTNALTPALTIGVEGSAAGRVGIGATPSAKLHVNTGTNENLWVGSLGGSGAGVYLASVNDSGSANTPLQIGSASDIRFAISGTEAARVDSSRRLLVGTSSSSGNFLLEVNGAIKDSAGPVRSVPQNSQTSGYTLVASDTGKHISITTGGVTVPASVFSVGDVISIYNNSGSNQTITQGASTTLRQAGTANTGNRTLAQYGVATVLCVASNTFVISGAGLS